MEQHMAQQMVQAIERLSSLSPLEEISMVMEVIIGCATIFLLYSLFQNRAALQLQSKASQASIFSSISERIDSLLDQQQYEDDGGEAAENWLERLINAFEYYAFFVNNGYLDSEMETYYRDAIKDVSERIREYPSLLDHLKGSTEGELNELRKYCKNIAKTELPF